MNGISNKRNKWLIIIILLILILGSSVGWILRDVPGPLKLSKGEFPESSKILDRNGKLLYEIYADKKRTEIPLSEIPQKMIQATLAIEDINFYKHFGFDWRGIIRGAYRTIFQKRLQGGSTLTQQLVKNALLTPERTWSRKVKEALLTLATEIIYSKNQILEMYFNQIPYGGTLWGVEAAAKDIFNKSAKDLNLAESALLAGLPAAPSKYSPFSHPELAKERQEQVLKRMLEVNFITQEEYQQAIEEKLNYYLVKQNIEAPHFVFYIKEMLTDKYGAERVTEGGLQVYTTLNLEIQKMAEATVSAEINQLKKLKVTNGATLITSPKTGEILAMVGSKDYFADDIDGKYNVTTALRQPGSAIKPLNYAVAIETGKITAASILFDGPTCFPVENQKPYCPVNYGNKFYGIQSTRNALANSINIPAVKVLKLNGLETFIASASAFGIKTFKDPSNYGLSLTLGGGEVQMTDMAVAFGVLANGGIKKELNPILKIIDKNGKVLEEASNDPGIRVLSRETAFIIQQILSDNQARSLVFGPNSMLVIKNHPEVAVKTGTTNDMRDNWTIGYTPDYVVLTWVGNNNNARMGGLVSGVTGAAPIWHEITTQLLKDKEIKKPTKPAGIVGQSVCNLTGGAIPPEGCESHFEYFKKEFLPPIIKPSRQNVLIDKDSGRIVKPEDHKPNTQTEEHLVFPDATGELICLDCLIVEPTPTPLN
ncbi:MAG TPA: transglycosylase domain-containing protein [Candidatus Woesebacteria bacterium]|nr:transglycosylase domain-containing protein [Candidatus Woesebacteria bacterium]